MTDLRLEMLAKNSELTTPLLCPTIHHEKHIKCTNISKIRAMSMGIIRSRFRTLNENLSSHTN